MTEIVRTTSTVVTTEIILDKSLTKTKAVEHVTVRSIRCNRVDASVVRAFVAALDQAEAPGRTIIGAYRSDVGHLVQLEAKWENEIVESADPGRQDDTAPADAKPADDREAFVPRATGGIIRPA